MTNVTAAQLMLEELADLGISRIELAARSGLARETLSRWAHGTTQPSLEALEQLAAAAGCRAELVLHHADPGDVGLALDQLALPHAQRFEQLLDERDWPAAKSALQAAAALDGLGVLVGRMAAAFHGAPGRPGRGAVDMLTDPAASWEIDSRLFDRDVVPEARESSGGERRTRWATPGGGVLRTRTTASGLDAAALRAGAHHAHVSGIGVLSVARVEDLRDLALVSAWSEELTTHPGLCAVLATSRYSTRAARPTAPAAAR